MKPACPSDHCVKISLFDAREDLSRDSAAGHERRLVTVRFRSFKSCCVTAGRYKTIATKTNRGHIGCKSLEHLISRPALPVCALTLTSTENERVDDQNSAFVGPQNLVGYLSDGEIVVFIGENPPKIQIHPSTESTPF